MATLRIQSFDCGRHELSYRSTKAGCPLCDAERQLKSMRDSLTVLVNESTMLKEENIRLKAQVDLVGAFRDAINLLDDDDRAFLKSVLYLWRDEKSVSLRLLYEWRDMPTGRRGRKQSTRTAVGFLVVPRQGDSYAYSMTSIGGMSIASNFEEAARAYGQSDAMKYLTRGLADLLPGSIR